MSGIKAALITFLLGPLALACGSDASFGDVKIELCSSLTARATSVEVIIARPEGFAMPLPEGTALEEFDGPSPEELVWQVPMPAEGWGDTVPVHLGQLVGTERVAARVHFAGGEAASLLQPVTVGVSLAVCDTDQDAGTGDAGSGDGGPVFDAGPDNDGGILQNDVRITSSVVGDSTFPSMVSMGTDVAVAWVDTRDGNSEIYFARLQGDGTAIGAQVRVTDNPSNANAPSLVWNGSEFGLAWHDDRDGNDEIYFVRISALGAVLGPPTRITNAMGISGYPSLVANADGYAVAWEDDRLGHMQVYFARIDAAGDEVDDDLRISATASPALAASLAWTGSIYGLAWHDSRDGASQEIYFATLTSLGVQNLADQRITTNDALSLFPSLVWDGVGFALAFEDGRDGLLSIYFAQLSTLGVKAAAEIPLGGGSSTARSVELKAIGNNYAAVWADNRTGVSEIRYADINGAGVFSGSSFALTDTGAGAGEPSLVRAGSQTKVIWQDSRQANSELYFQASAP